MKRASIALFLGIVGLVTACGDSDDQPSTASSAASTATTSVPTSTAPDASTASTAAPTVTLQTAASTSTTTSVAAHAASIDDLLKIDRPLVIAHTGGEDEYPGSTMFAFAESVKAGSDMLDLNVLLSADGVLVIQHDDTVDRTSNGSGPVASLTASELAALDNAYWFTADGITNDAPPASYIYRGVRTGTVAPPAGYTADDFGIPTLDDLIARFPGIPLGIEIKGSGEPAQRAADALLTTLRNHDLLANTVISSFDDATIDYLHQQEPAAILSPALNAMSGWVLDNTPLPNGMTILQLPPVYGSVTVITPELIKRSHDAGYVIWVWPNDRDLETADAYRDFIAAGIDGLNINFPTVAVDVVTAMSG